MAGRLNVALPQSGGELTAFDSVAAEGYAIGGGVALVHIKAGYSNTHLIAAAPDLLEALREVVRISDRKHDAWDQAKAAIAKAEGGAS